MDEIIVSFCISSYCRYKVLKELVLEILSVESNKFDIIVCDDCSTDETYEKITMIKDKRLKVYTNKKNMGGPFNICRTLDYGDGYYLFYINERDNVNSLKIKKFIGILEELKDKKVAFAQCLPNKNLPTDYDIYEAGNDALLTFACRIVHPTGYIFRRDIWNMITNRSVFFIKECYGDYGLTLVSAIISLKYRGSKIYGDFCDVKRKRIDFSKEKSRYLKKKKDQRMWYSAEVQWRELMIAYKFLKKIHIRNEVLDELLHLRYREYLGRIVIKEPANTIHYNIKPVHCRVIVKIKSIINGIFLWNKMSNFCLICNRKNLYKLINKDTLDIYKEYFLLH